MDDPVVVNEPLEVVYFCGHTGLYLQPPVGVPTVSFLDLCPLELRSELRFLLETAFKSGQVISCEGMRMSAGELAKMLCITVRPFPNERSQTDLLVVFEEDGTQESPAPLSETRRRGGEMDELPSALQETCSQRRRGAARALYGECPSATGRERRKGLDLRQRTRYPGGSA